MSEDLKTTESKLWEEFRKTFPDSQDNILKKDEIVKKINDIRKAQNLEPWNKWTKEEALKKLAESNQSGGKGKFFPAPRKTETKIEELTKFNEFIDQLYKEEIGDTKKSKSLWRQDNIQYLEILLQVFNGQVRTK
ncbi:MAG: hypothetical protein HZC29_04220 [Thaumarchaeota archaeon]|nr:hypothetical protein [Nitrososphaerota archaeon]